ncbi:neuraminidase-like domain-containing protein [Morganella morganii]|uniref:Tc toxin subunit A-related protein n=1 Tax=Morganella morganii TaxID=582 RepID=UPI00092465AD|nr:neuraminidase-like domain-containing protein [Morganella morganii]SHM67350.1 virulence plasmid A protein [Morganella morganii]
MQTLAAILKKVSNESDDTAQTLCDLIPLSYAEIYERYHDVISDDEARILFQQAQIQKKKNQFTDAQITAHNNPQIKNIPCLYTGQSPELRYENDFIPDRISEYAEPGMVSSMFSPAAYLTELYREAKALHKQDSKYHLDKRRPDLKNLSLSQENLDDEISTLELSNDVLFTALKGTGDEQSVLQRLSEKYKSINLPYHDPFQIIKKVSELKKIFPAVNKHPLIINNKISKSWLKTIYCNLSPALSGMLKEIYENIDYAQDEKLNELIKKYIADDFSYFYYLKNVMNYLRLTNEEFSILSDFFNMKDDANSGNIIEYKKNLLKLRGVVSLHKALELPLDTIIFVLKSFGCELLNEKAINALINLKIARDNYQLRDEDIAVLLGGGIVKDKVNTDISQFDRIFNNPPLGGAVFKDDNTELNFFTGNYPDNSHERFIINCLKRSLGVNESGLAGLCEFIYGKQLLVKCNIEFLSLCYRTVLISRVNHIPVNELIILFRLLPDVFKDNVETYKLSDDIYDVLYNVNYYTAWFNKTKLSISMCDLLLNRHENITVSQGVKDVMSEIRNGLNEKDFDEKVFDINKLITKLSPVLSSVLDTSSVNAMASVLQWMNTLKPEGMTLKTLISNVYNNVESPDKKENKAVIFMIKMSVMINMISIDDALLSSWINKPYLLDKYINTLEYNLNLIKMMIDASSVIKNSGEKSDSIISELNDSKLSYKTIADVFSQNEKIVQQALKYLDEVENIRDYRSLTDVAILLDSFTETGISPDDFTKLFGPVTEKKDYTYYYNLSKIAESILEQDKFADLNGTLNKLRSSALCSLFTLEKLNDLHHENDSTVVYKYLLIDTEISEEIKTTKIAEAITSIQLYVSHCLNNIEKEVESSVRSRQFFRNWEAYNRRYSTWAALSMLVYYPENYVDPVIRTGKTAMMDKLQQLISQDGIKKETIDNAFRSYLTAFEKIANLNVISAYHDDLDIKKGKTYFIGYSVFSKNDYYIRSVNHEGVGKEANNRTMPSLVWSGWDKISCGVNPYMNIIRPVIFNGRLHIVWLELTSIKLPKNEKDKGSKAAENEIVKHEAKLFFSYLSYDNTWSEPDYIDLSSKVEGIISLTLSVNGIPGLSFYCSNSINDGDLYCFFYNKHKGTINGVTLRLSGDYVAKDLSDSDEISLIEKIKNCIDSPEEIKVVNVYSNAVINIMHDSSDDTFDQLRPAFLVDSIFIENTGNGFDPGKENYNFSFKFKFMLNKTMLLVNNRYTAYFQYCQLIGWGDSNVYESISYLKERIYIDSDNFIDSIVLVFNKKDKKYALFLYNSLERKRVNINKNLLSYFKMHLKIDGRDYVILDIEESQSDKGVFPDVYSIADFINQESKSVCFELKYASISYITFNARKVGLLFCRDFSSVSINARFKLNDTYTNYNESQWLEAKNKVGSDGFEYISKGKLFSTSFESKDVDNYRDKKINFDIVGYVDSILAFIYKCTCYIGLFDSAYNVVSIKSNSSKAQYLEFHNKDSSVGRRIRLNTLFANKLVSMANKGIDNVLLLSNQGLIEPDINSGDTINQVPMDFHGANALYFWEMFYYAPMMIADILLQHQSYNEAERWLQYIFNPAGYIENDIYTGRYWNVRPLAEDEQWNESLPDDTDPDAIALADPMHYKMATFMKTLELIIARGDKAYRELERDSLNEAKSWYIQALSLLGKEPVTLLNKNWSSPDLAGAAKATMQRLLMQVNSPADSSFISVNSANTLTNVFKPQLNEKLIACRETINQRLFNLRNGLSINGQRLYLPIFSSPADPRNMLESQVNNINSEKIIINKKTLMYRFPAVIENAKSLVSQLIEFGDKLLSFNESRDNEQFSELLIHQGNDLLSQNIRIQDEEIKSLLAERKSLLAQQSEIINRETHYSQLYSEGISTEEKLALMLNLSSAAIRSGAAFIDGNGKYLDLAPNTYGTSVGGSKWSAATGGVSEIMEGTALLTQSCADAIEKSAEYSRRSQEWQLEAESAREEKQQIAAELEAMDMQITAAKMQKHYIVTEQRQNQQQLQFLQRKFTRAELYGWLRGRLMAIYSPFYDLAVSRCFMAEDAYRYEMNVNAADRSFINISAWRGAYSGLMAGESLMLNLVQLEEAYLEKDKRVLEVTRTVSLAEVYNSERMGNNKFSFADVTALVDRGELKKIGSENNYVALIDGKEQANNKELQAVIQLNELGIDTDYPKDLGDHRLIMQISVTLPALIEPYQNVRALLEYEGEGDSQLPQGCKSIAVSHGMNDSGLFHLQFGDSTYLPFEGLSVKSNGKFKLRFFDVGGGDQKRLLQTLTDIVLHIRYTIYK